MKMFLILVLLVTGVASAAHFNSLPQSTPRLRGILREACSREWPEARIEVTSISTREVAPDSAMLIHLNPTPPIGAVNFELVWEENGVAHKTVGNGVVKVYRPVAVATHPISHGEAFSEENTQFVEKEITRFTQTGFFTHWNDLKGKVAKGYVRTDTLIGLINSEKPVEILQGQMVDLRNSSPQMVISARMKALENGRMGNWIRVENPTSKKVIRAKVTAPGQVELR